MSTRNRDPFYEGPDPVLMAGDATLRDAFAGKALQGLLANPGGPIQANGTVGWDMTNCTNEDVAALAYRMADAMLAAREAA